MEDEENPPLTQRNLEWFCELVRRKAEELHPTWKISTVSITAGLAFMPVSGVRAGHTCAVTMRPQETDNQYSTDCRTLFSHFRFNMRDELFEYASSIEDDA
jgi:hypothetical protein